MNATQMIQQIKRLISNEVLVGVNANEIDDEASLIADLHLDSIQMIELVTSLENEFSIELEDEDLDLQFFSTVKALAEFVQSKLT